MDSVPNWLFKIIVRVRQTNRVYDRRSDNVIEICVSLVRTERLTHHAGSSWRAAASESESGYCFKLPATASTHWPDPLQSVCVPVADISGRAHLHSAERWLSEQDFHVAATVIWNLLSVQMRSTSAYSDYSDWTLFYSEDFEPLNFQLNKKFISGSFLFPIVPSVPFLPFLPPLLATPRNGPSNPAEGFGGALLAPIGGLQHLQPPDTFSGL